MGLYRKDVLERSFRYIFVAFLDRLAGLFSGTKSLHSGLKFFQKRLRFCCGTRWKFFSVSLCRLGFLFSRSFVAKIRKMLSRETKFGGKFVWKRLSITPMDADCCLDTFIFAWLAVNQGRRVWCTNLKKSRSLYIAQVARDLCGVTDLGLTSKSIPAGVCQKVCCSARTHFLTQFKNRGHICFSC